MADKPEVQPEVKKTRISRRTFIALTGIAVAGVAAAYVGSQYYFSKSSSGQTTVTWAIDEDLTTLDPISFTTTSAAQGVLSLIYEQPFTWNPAGGYTPLLATSWTNSTDGLTWTFNLRQGVTFQDGSPFNADAVTFFASRVAATNLYGIKTDPSKNSLWSPLVADVKAIDDYTVSITLDSAYGPFLSTFFDPGALIASPAAVQKYQANYGSQAAVGTGQYQFVDYVPNEKLVLQKYAGYWGTPAKVDNIVVEMNTDDTSRVASLQAGDTNMIENVPTSDVSTLTTTKTTVLQSPTNRATVLFIANANNPTSPFYDVRVRQAMAYCVDTTSLANTVLNGYVVPLSHPLLAPLVFGYTNVGSYQYNVDMAKSLLSAAGYPNGFNATLLTSSWIPYATETAQAIQGMASQVGINITITNIGETPFFAAVEGTKPIGYDLIHFAWGVSNNDASYNAGKAWGTTSVFNMCQYGNSTTDALITSAVDTVDTSQRLSDYNTLYQGIFNAVQTVPLFYPDALTGADQSLQGVVVRFDGVKILNSMSI